MTAPAPLAFSWSGFYFGAHAGYGFGKAPFVDGPVVGGQVGANWHFDGFVLGAEADGSWADLEGTDAIGTARLRGGFAYDRFLVYATGGAAFQDLDNVGWVVGGGVEYAITRNISAGAEYLYLEFEPGTADIFRGRVNYRFGAGMLPASVLPAATAASTPLSYNWTGFYVGAHGGYGFVGGPDISDGYEVGGQLGVNRQFDQFVAGIEIEGGSVDWGPVTTAGSIRLRGGLAFDRFLAYAAGGMGVEDSIGWTVGGGVEYGLTDRISLGAEYLHHDFIGGHGADIMRARASYLFNGESGL
jgi:outer membrane immunogenic protein